MSYLIDTNVISEIVRKKPDKNVIQWFSQIPEESLFLSLLTLGEIRKGVEQLADEPRKSQLKVWLEHELPPCFSERVLPINQEVAERWGRLQAQTKRPLPAIDSLLAATALHYDLAIITRNVLDFSNCGLELINPWEINYN